MSDPVDARDVPFTVEADLEVGKALRPWLRDGGADVVVRRGEVPEALSGTLAQGAAWQCALGRMLVKPPSGMRFLVEDGKTIRYAANGADDLDVRLFLFGSPWAALVLQRGLLPLQASAVATGRNVFAFACRPRRGKSTLAAALAARGRAFFADDMLVLDPTSFASSPKCWGCTDLKLWPDSVEMTGASAEAKVRTATGFDMMYATPAALSHSVSGRLKELYALHRRNSDRPCRIKRVAGRRSLTTLREYVYRLQYALAIVGSVQLSRWLVALANSISVWQFQRPMLRSQFDYAVAHIDGALPSRWTP